MLVHDSYFYSLSDREFYERFERYQPDARDFVNLAQRLLPNDWTFSRQGIWFYCTPSGATLPMQGWKIHLSATLGNATSILATACRVLQERRIPFKHSVDKGILYHQNSKRWPRGGAGKFMTIYPSSTEQCGELLESLYQEMIGYNGPYILSDRRYKDSKVVYYRYGGILPLRQLKVSGDQGHVIQGSDGEVISDERQAFFQLPAGISDPFVSEAESEEPGDGTLKNGRYTIESVLSFSNSGGVYIGRDNHTGAQVVIKEARPFTNVSPRGTDSVWLLKKEHRLLTVLQDTGVAPRPIDFFQDWEHFFLVQEFVDGIILRGHNTRNAINLKVRPSLEDAEAFYARFRRVHVRIAEILQVLHDRNIVFSDISHNNVIVREDGEDIKLIDFEGAYERGVDVPTLLFTPGFAPLQVLEEGMAQPEDDYYAFGSLMLAALFPTNSIMALDPRAFNRFLQSGMRDLGLPESIVNCIRGLMHPERAHRMGFTEAIQVLRDGDHPVRAPRIGTHEADQEDGELLLQRLVDYIDSTATFDRDDRLFPSDPALFGTNPLSVAYGACGVAFTMKQITGEVRPEVLEWILARDISPESYPPGLYVGLSGIAWSLLECGLRDKAEEIVRMTHDHPLLWDSPDIFYGAAGWGMAQLRFFLATGDDLYLAKAEEAGRFLMQSRKQEKGESWWPSQGWECCGMAHGASGVSLFLLYLSMATRDESYLAVGQSGLEYAIARGIPTPDGALTWRAKEGEPTVTPYWRWGSGGIGMTLLRYQKALGDDRYQGVLDDLTLDNDRKYTIFPGRFFGLAGLGEFLMDLAEFGGDRARAMAMAHKVLSGILLFKLERKGGAAFPGDNLMRISCDLGTGTAGIALFLHRFLRQAPPAFMLDELLNGERGATTRQGTLILPQALSIAGVNLLQPT
jgi:serine/threonine protein kinase